MLDECIRQPNATYSLHCKNCLDVGERVLQISLQVRIRLIFVALDIPHPLGYQVSVDYFHEYTICENFLWQYEESTLQMPFSSMVQTTIKEFKFYLENFLHLTENMLMKTTVQILKHFLGQKVEHKALFSENFTKFTYIITWMPRVRQSFEEPEETLCDIQLKFMI